MIKFGIVSIASMIIITVVSLLIAVVGNAQSNVTKYPELWWMLAPLAVYWFVMGVCRFAHILSND